MVSLPLPGARRRRRPPDPRILVGVVLVAASAAGTTALVAATTRSVTAYTVAHALIAGERVDRSELVPVAVRLGDAQGLYLSGTLPTGDLVATRTVGAGEVVPRSALGTTVSQATATVVVDLASSLAEGVAAGSTVDLWSAPKKDEGVARYGAPVVLVSGATVARVVHPTGLVVSGAPDSIEVQVPRREVAAVLEAVADGDRVSAVSVGGALR